MAQPHDQRFKVLIQTFFAEFLQLFFAKWASRLDLTTITWLDKESFRNPPDGDVKHLDLVAQVPALSAAHETHELPWLVLVHIEVESADRTTSIKSRFPHYYHLLRAKYQQPILPIVIYLDVAQSGIGEDEYTETMWDFVVNRFRFLYVGLPALDGLQYVMGDNWLGVALSALMKIPREKVAWLGAEALKRLCEAPIPDAKRYLLAECVQAYLPMDAKQQQEYQALLDTPTYRGVKEMNKTVREEGIEEGLAKGMAQGIAHGMERGIAQGMEKGIAHGMEKGQIRALILFLEGRFGPVSASLREHIESLSKADLNRVMLKVFQANTFEETGFADI